MTRLDIETAVVAGLSLILPLYFLMKWEALYSGTGSFPNTQDITNFALIILSYLAVAILLQGFRKYAPNYSIPSWIFISVLGSFLFVFIYGAMNLTLAQLFLGKWRTILYIFIVFSIYTLPFTALVHYSGAITEKIKRWHYPSGSNHKIFKL